MTARPLPSTVNSPVTESRIRGAAVRKFHTRDFETFFEHGHWWLVLHPRDPDKEQHFDVVDANSDPSGFDFEEV